MPIHVTRRIAVRPKCVGRRWLLASLLLVCWATPLWAQFGEGLIARDTRREAIAAIPFQHLDANVQQTVHQIVSSPTLYRRLPVRTIECEQEMYLFLIRNPEVVVSMWQLIGITQVGCKRLGPYSFEGTDGAGTVTRVDLVYGTPQQHLYVADGQYEGPLMKRMTHGKCVMLLTSDYAAAADRRTQITSQLDLFVQLDNVGADFVAKTLHPLVGKVADANFIESVNFLSQVSRAAEKKGDSVQLLAQRMTQVAPEVRAEFVQVSATVHQRAQQRPVAAAAEAQPLELPTTRVRR